MPTKTKRIDYQEALATAARSMIRFKKPEHLIKMIVKMIRDEVRITHAGVLLYKGDKDYYVLIESSGEKGLKMPVGYIRLNKDSGLIRMFLEDKVKLINKQGVLVKNNLKYILHLDNLLSNGKFSKFKNFDVLLCKADEQMELLKAAVCIPSFFKNDLLGILILGDKLSGEHYSERELGLFVTLANDAAMAIKNAELIESLHQKLDEIEGLYEKEHRLFIHTSIALAAAIDAKDPYTHGHTERVTRYSLAIYNELPTSDRKCSEEVLHIAALLHDIGKIGIPDSVLNKKGTLDKEEFKKIQQHPIIGAGILQPIREYKDIIDGVHYHHERVDGTGYPYGLKGEQIPFTARIIALADAYDAMATDRPYRKQVTDEKILDEVEKNSNIQFDAEIVKAFMRAYSAGKIAQIRN